MRGPADWQLPAGVDRGLWDYVHDPHLAQRYDASLQGVSLLEVDQAFVDQHCPQQGRLLDLGCGTGRLLVPFARKGHPVLGVDLSPCMLAQAQQKATQAQVHVDLLRANLTELECLADQRFDCACCLFSTLGMIRGADHRRRVVAHAYRLLRDGGIFILHVHNRWFNFWNRGGRWWLVQDVLRRVLARQDVETGDFTMPVHQGLAGLTLHLFTRGETVHLLRDVGFQIREVRPISLRADGVLPAPWWFGWLRAYGYLIAAQRVNAGGK